MFLKTAMPDIPSTSATAGHALPKINVPPAPEAAESIFGAPTPETRISLETEKRPPFAWDFNFSLGLIILVVAVNMALALLLGKTGDVADPAAAQTLAKPQERPFVPRTSDSLERLAPAAGETADGKAQTRTYISPEDQRLLLQYLETPADRRPASSSN